MWSGRILNRAGFTYLELILVIAIMAVIAVLALPLFAGVGDSRKLESAAWRLVSEMRLARQTAISTGKTVRIEFRVEANDYRIWYPDETVRVKLPEGITISGNNFPLKKNSIGIREVSFTPTGAPTQGGTVTFKNSRGDRLYVITTPATARTRLSKDPPAHW